jgi:hypothetical protein
MPDHVDSQAYHFADDTKVYKEIKTQTDTTSLQKDLDNLQEWSDKWLLKFHPNKCKVIHIIDVDHRGWALTHCPVEFLW